MQLDLAALSENPTAGAKEYASMITKYPVISEHLKRSFDVLEVDQQRTAQAQALNIYSAIDAGEVGIAKKMLEEQKAAAENSGVPERAQSAEVMLKLLEVNPQAAKTSAGLALSATMGPKQFGDVFTKLQTERRERGLAPAKLSKAQADAAKAATEAKFAESKAAADLENKGWDTTKIQEDIKIAKENSRIATMNNVLKKETNDLKRSELKSKIENAATKRDELVRTKAAEASSAFAGFDNTLSTIDSLLENPELDNILGAVEGSAFYPSTLMGLAAPWADADKRADAIATLETIQSQQFLNNLLEAKQKGAAFGSLTEREGDKLTGYVKNLKTKQSEKQFRKNLAEIQRLTSKARANTAAKFGIPEPARETPETTTAPDIETAQGEIDALLLKYGAPQ